MPIDPEDPRLTAYALGELEDDEKTDLERLLSDSEEGRRVVGEIRETARLLADTLGEEIAPGLSARQWKAIEQEIPAPVSIPYGPQPSWAWRRWAGYGIAASLLLGFGASAGWLAHDQARKSSPTGPLALGPAPKAAPAVPTPPTVQVPPPALDAEVVDDAKPEDAAMKAPAAEEAPRPAASTPLAAVVVSRMVRGFVPPAPSVPQNNALGEAPSNVPQLGVKDGPAMPQPAKPSPSPTGPPTNFALRTDGLGAAKASPATPDESKSRGRMAPGRASAASAENAARLFARSDQAAIAPEGLASRSVDPSTKKRGDESGKPANQAGYAAGKPGAKAGGDAASKPGSDPSLAIGRDRYYYEQQTAPSLAKRKTQTSYSLDASAAASVQPPSYVVPRSVGGGGLGGASSPPNQVAMGGGMGGGMAGGGMTAGRSATVPPSRTTYAPQAPALNARNDQSRHEVELDRLQKLSRRAAGPEKDVNALEKEVVNLQLAQDAKVDRNAANNALGQLQENLQDVTREKRDRVPILDPIPGEFGQQVVAPAVEAPAAEVYNPIKDNEFKAAAVEPLSTFSIDVDTASYANVRRLLMQDNSLPPRDAVRIEEMINYFPYDYPAPANDKPDAPPFSVNVEVARCPWNAANRLAKIGLKGKVDAQKKVANLVFLIDVSGSMDEPNKLPLVQASLRMLVEQLGENDRVSIVVYAGAAGLVLDSTSGLRKHEIASGIDQLRAGGSTAGGAGINLAYDIARKHFVKGGVNRVILCTDGDFNVGVSDDKTLQALITEKAKTGVFLTVLGYGTGNLKDSKMEQLADKGNGNCYYIDSLIEARKVLVEQMGGTLVTVGKDVKIQVDFNPAKVGSYRLIGYENRALEAKDFADDKKDAGEIGAGHTVTALYELTPPDKEVFPSDLKSNYVRNELREPKSPQSFTVKLRYKEPDGSASKLLEHEVTDGGKDFAGATEDFKFASSVAAFGMILRDSPHRGNATFNALLEWAESGKGKDASGYRKEFCDIVKKARDLTAPPK